ncbi:hypothetical protein BN2537_4421 [Streptomyces venezuelae]|nr:hypothetical protein BN2537_4421 [Streptomyces venezuelae]
MPLARDDLNFVNRKVDSYPEILVAEVHLADGCRVDLEGPVPGITPGRPCIRDLEGEMDHEFLSSLSLI